VWPKIISYTIFFVTEKFKNKCQANFIKNITVNEAPLHDGLSPVGR